MSQSTMARVNRAIPLLLLLLLVAFFAQFHVFAPPNQDDLQWYHPQHSFIYRHLYQSITWPAWNPLIGGGIPTSAEIACHPWHPLMIAMYPISPLYFQGWFTFAMILISSAVLYRWLHGKFKNPAGAVAGALVYVTSGAFLYPVLEGYYDMAVGACHLPLMIACTDYVILSPSRKTAAYLALAAGSTILAANTQYVYYVFLAAGVFAGCLLITMRSLSLRARFVSGGAALIGVALGMALGSADLGPKIAQFDKFEPFRQIPEAQRFAFSTRLPDGENMTLPLLFRLMLGGAQAYGSQATVKIFSAYFVGLPALLLAAIGLADPNRFRRAIPMAVLGALGLVIMLGEFSFLNDFLVRYVPGFYKFRKLPKAGMMFDLAVAYFACQGIACLLRRRRWRVAEWLSAFASCFGAPLLLAGYIYASMWRLQDVRGWNAKGMFSWPSAEAISIGTGNIMLVVVAILAIIAMRMRMIRARLTRNVSLMLGVGAILLTPCVFRGHAQKLLVELLRSPRLIPIATGEESTPEFRCTLSQDEGFPHVLVWGRVDRGADGVSTTRELFPRTRRLRWNTGMYHDIAVYPGLLQRLYPGQALLMMVANRLTDDDRRKLILESLSSARMTVGRYEPRVLDLLGFTHILSNTVDPTLYPDAAPRENTKQYFLGHRTSAVGIGHFFPTARFVEGDRISDWSAAIYDPGFVPRDHVLLLKSGESASSANPDDESALGFPVPPIRWIPHRFEFQLEAPTSGYFLFRQNVDPNWQCFLNGRNQPFQPANAAFMAVPVKPGANHVVFEYVPKEQYIFLGVSFVAAALIGFCLITRPSTRKHVLPNVSR